MTKTANKKAAKIARRPVYGVWTKVRVLETGEERLALVAAHPIDRRICKERKYRAGDEIRMELKKPRNVKFHRLMHGIGQLLVEHAPGFELLDAHGAIKRVQREAGVCCEEMVVDMGELRFGDMVVPIGERPVKVPESIAFDDMSEERFRELYDGVTKHIVENYWSGMSRDVIEEMALMMQGEG
ncbi:hypothetical protein [Lysobacter fragariae]